MPQAIATDERICGRDLRVFVYVCGSADGRTGICRLKQETIATAVKSDRKGVNRSLKHLVDCGYLQVRQPKGARRSLEYRVVLDDDATGQMNLFPGRGSQAPSERTSSRGLEAPSGRGLEAPPKEQSSFNRDEPSGSAMPRATPANDFRDGAREQSGTVGERSGAWASKAEVDALSRTLREAAGESINTAHPGLLVLAEPLGWLAAGCDLELDILPTIVGIAARGGRPAQSWRYFAPAVLEARDRRVAAKEVRHLPPATSRPPLTDAAARRREGGTGRFAEHFEKRREQMRQQAEDPAEVQSQWSTLELRANER